MRIVTIKTALGYQTFLWLDGALVRLDELLLSLLPPPEPTREPIRSRISLLTSWMTNKLPFLLKANDL